MIHNDRNNRSLATEWANRRIKIKLAIGWLLGCWPVVASLPYGDVAAHSEDPSIRVSTKESTQSSSSRFATKELMLPGANGLVTLDYFAWDQSTQKLWVPAGNLASVDVIDGKTDEIARIGGFQTTEVELRGRKVMIGPTSVTVGKGVVYVGSRADSSICVINVKTLKVGECIRIASPSEGLAAAPDGVVYVEPTQELWVTRGAPPLGIPSPDQSITILDASDAKLKLKTKIPLGGSAEGYAVDER